MNEIRVSNAVIDNITIDRRASYVTISYTESRQQRQTVQLVVTENTIIRDESGFMVTIWELQQGMIVDAVFSSAMTMSIPPQANAFRIRIVRRPQAVQTTYGRIIEINNRNQSITTICSCNLASRIQFNISSDTEIIGLRGRRISLRDLWIGAQVRVEHASFMTSSIPPQTIAYIIQVIG